MNSTRLLTVFKNIGGMLLTSNVFSLENHKFPTNEKYLYALMLMPNRLNGQNQYIIIGQFPGSTVLLVALKTYVFGHYCSCGISFYAK